MGQESVQTLDDLKAEEEAAEAQTDENEAGENELNESPQGSDNENDTDSVDGENAEDGEGAEPNPDDTKDPETEDWMKGDDHASQAEKKYTGQDIGDAKARLKTKLDKRHSSELDEKDARIAELERAANVAKPVSLERPKREDFYDEDDSDAAYDAAYEKYLLNKMDSRQVATNETTQQQQQQEKAKQKLAEGEDAHYERADKLVKKSDIKPETYQAADLAFRQAIDNAVKGGGDNIAAHFMGLLGEGSVEVVYNMGINAEKLEKLTSLLREDPNGLKATVFLTELKGELTSPKKRKTNTPTPAPDINSDVQSKGQASALEKKFASAKTSQLQMDILREARAAGVDSKNW